LGKGDLKNPKKGEKTSIKSSGEATSSPERGAMKKGAK